MIHGMEPNIQEIKEFLETPKTFAIIGASTNEKKAGNYVPKFMMDRDFKIIPVNPFADEILGLKPLKDIDDLEQKVDCVIIYRRAEDAVPEVEKSIAKGIPWIWLPKGVTSDKAKELASSIKYVQDACPKELIEEWTEKGEWHPKSN